ncbi:MAG: glycoside hydrolase family 3 C-terminal domain-containing protein [Clostridia bacterium]|nr:glycoside hydrolase family 3 C-terminal domain-containing protein [Clostridia bacterium]
MKNPEMQKKCREQAEKLVAQMTLPEKISQMQHTAPAIERLGIPAYNWWNEALHGYARSGTATVFPQAIGMAASFNTDLLYTVGEAISIEARAKYNEYKKFGDTGIYQGLTCWSPNINIFRDPRWGRGHETYGEDPYLTARMGTAFVTGMQGEGKYRRVDTCLKHFAAHSGPESQRHGFNAVVEEKDMRDTYLWAFKYCIDHADPASIMGAYNRTNGEPCCASKTLLQDILYGEWGYDGYVVSDCGAICDIDANHKVTATRAESAALAVNNGCALNCGSAFPFLKEAVAEGLISEETITEAVTRLFTARYRLGMFADDCEYDAIPYDVVACEDHRVINRKMAQESIVLLKNDGILPLKRDTRVAVIGPNASSYDLLLANYCGTADSYTTLLAGIMQASRGRVTYAKGCHLFRENLGQDDGISAREALVAARVSDVVIMCMGLDAVLEGEEGTLNTEGLAVGDKATLNLPKSQLALYEEIKKTGKPIVFVNVSGSCIDLSDMKENCAAVIQQFYPGAEGGHALADVLYGDVSPSGRLPVTFYRSVEDLPDFADYSMENRTYRFFRGEPVYPFGAGLTYSTIREEWLDESTVVVHNDGSVDTAYSVLKFEKDPADPRLCGFEKIFLKAGESKTVVFER